MNEHNNIISMDTPENPLQELLKKGAQQLLAQAIEAELAILLEKYENDTINSLKRVVRNCYQPERNIQTGLGDIEEIFIERGIYADYSTYNRWVIRFAPQIEMKARKTKRAVSGSWRMDETCIKIKGGEWWYYYRAVDKSGDIADFYLSKEHDENAARAFLRKAIGSNGLPHKVVIDKNGVNALALHHINTLLWFSSLLMLS